MVTTDVELQLRQQLKEASKRLLAPPTSDDELLHVLDQTERLLSKVDQSPNDLMKEALGPLTNGMVDRSLLHHSNVDVKVALASCLSEITRITAPDAPYGDEDLNEVLKLIVSTFEDLPDKSSSSYDRRVTILETVAKVRSCVIMLDLECEELIVEMFNHFLKSIREHHADIIFSSMVDIMDLIFTESEDISVNMLKPLLFSIKNDSEGVLPVSRKLGETVLQKSKAILRPFLFKTLSNLGDSLSDYSPVLAAAICEGATVFEQNDMIVLAQQQTDESQVANERAEEAPQAEESKITTVSSNDATQVVKENSERPAETVATPSRTLKIVMSNGGRVTVNEKDSHDKESSKKPEEAVDHQDSSLTSKVDVNDSVAEVAKAESKPESNKEGNEIDATMESVVPSDSSHEKENDIQVPAPEVESKPEETSNKEENKTDVTMTSAEEPSDSSHAENKDEKTDENKDDKSDANVDETNKDDGNEDEKNKDDQIEDEKKEDEKSKGEKNDDVKVDLSNVAAVETEAANVPEESNVEKVDVSNKKVSPQEEEAEVAKAGPESQSGGLPYKIHVRKGPRSKKKSLIKDDTPLIDVIKKASEAISDSDMKSPKGAKKKAPVVQKDKPEDVKKSDAVASGAKSEQKSGKKVVGGGGGSAQKKRKLSGKKSGGAKKAKQGGKTSAPLIKKDDDTDSFDKPLRQPAGKEDESDSDSKPNKLSAKKGNKSSAKGKDGKKNAIGGGGKNVEEKKAQVKSVPEDDMDISPKPVVKTATEEGKSEEASVTNSKRKRSVGKTNANKNVKYDDSLIGSKVKVWWPDDQKYYEGVIESFDSAKNKHKVSYVDGDEEILNLKKEKWEILKEFSVPNEEKPAEAQSIDDDETLSKLITYKSKGKNSANANDSTKSKSKSKSTGDDEKEKESGDGDAAATPEKSTETKKSGLKGNKKRKKKM